MRKGRGGKGHAGATAVRAAVATGQRPWQAARVVPVAVHCGPVVVVVPLSLSFVCVSLARRPRAWGRRPGSGEPGERVGALRRPRHVLHHPLRFGASDRDPAFGVLLAIQFEHRDSLTHSLTHSLSLTLTHFHSLSLTHSFRPVISLLILKTGTLETTLLYRYRAVTDAVGLAPSLLPRPGAVAITVTTTALAGEWCGVGRRVCPGVRVWSGA